MPSHSAAESASCRSAGGKARKLPCDPWRVRLRLPGRLPPIQGL